MTENLYEVRMKGYDEHIEKKLIEYKRAEVELLKAIKKKESRYCAVVLVLPMRRWDAVIERMEHYDPKTAELIRPQLEGK